MSLESRNTLLFLASIVLSFAANALQDDTQQPIEVEADHMVLQQTKGTAEYHGNVRLKQGSILITANRVTLFNRNGRLQSLLIKGGQDVATFEQKTDAGQFVRGKAMRIEYNAKQAHLVLLDSAELLQGNNLIRSDRIDYNTKSNNLTAGNQAKSNETRGGNSDSQRVRIVITPDEAQSNTE